ncbi:EmrB/QacA subfamily drug resistance transporter [Stackebrandtia endophytica]|uniref:EmrB/QacA subfamily drug resistance transporter n=1 Tax=Stackebrandtia endophytica TaxID=1496996 RepID=A0A543AXG8_9ACTN|nr:DHA2 family efflux MFS transporter permease subunit [Stackebrandtia endophytica]TQL77269.1 EmrB/QacA subfamily drug resistance transporter [Stackebrandtia endophytica]
MEQSVKPWPALWSLVIGFFMILVDATIVSVAMPAIMSSLNANITEAVWVTSAYLLAYAVPLLITGRLGDRFGPKTMYLIGLVVFTLSSIWCGMSTTIELLIFARVFQGLGASMMTPQTMAVITRTFPPDRRGTAMGLWGAVAGIASLTGPILGGLLVGVLGWQWIFFINVPIGVIAFIMAYRLVPRLSTNKRQLDMVGVVLSALGMFLLIFGIQEGESFDWGIIVGPVTVWSLVIAGVVILIGFVLWQRFNPREPLIPLGLFRDLNFSLSNIAIATMSFAVTSMALPLMLYAQAARGLEPFEAALLLIPMGVVAGGLAPVVGKLVDRTNPKYLAATGFGAMSLGLGLLGLIIEPDTPIWLLLIPTLFLGVGNACVWAPLASSATRNLPPHRAGAGSGVYNTTRQVGAVVGSAGIAAMMTARLAVYAPGVDADPEGVPEAARVGFAQAMAESLFLPAVVLLIGFGVVWFFAAPQREDAVADWESSGRRDRSVA